MLDVNTLPKRYRKLKNLLTSMTFSARSTIEKERKKEGKNISKQMCVRRDGALRGAASAYFLPSSQYS